MVVKTFKLERSLRAHYCIKISYVEYFMHSEIGIQSREQLWLLLSEDKIKQLSSCLHKYPTCRLTLVCISEILVKVLQ